jgi:preprotein translocase subunit SecE
VAEKNRRDEDAVDEHLDEGFDDAVDDDAEDEPVSRGGTATRSRKKAEPAGRPAKAKKDTDRVGLFGWISRFFREVVAELRKVIWPTRKELLTYTGVVIVFVTVVTAVVVGLDYVFAKAALWVFGTPE